MPADLSSLELVVQGQGGVGRSSEHLVRFDTRRGLGERRAELRLVATHLQHINYLLLYTSRVLFTCRETWQRPRKGIVNRFELLAELMTEHDESGDVGTELTALLLTGIAGVACTKFLKEYLHGDMVPRFLKAVKRAASALCELVSCNLQPAMEELMFRLAELRALAHCGAVGLPVATLDAAIEGARLLVLKVEELRKVVAVVRTNFLALFGWISNCKLALADDDEEEETPLAPEVVSLAAVEECIRLDLASDRLGALLEEVPMPPAAAYAPGPEALDPPPFRERWRSEAHVSFAGQLATFNELWTPLCKGPGAAIAPLLKPLRAAADGAVQLRSSLSAGTEKGAFTTWLQAKQGRTCAQPIATIGGTGTLVAVTNGTLANRLVVSVIFLPGTDQGPGPGPQMVSIDCGVAGGRIVGNLTFYKDCLLGVLITQEGGGADAGSTLMLLDVSPDHRHYVSLERCMRLFPQSRPLTPCLICLLPCSASLEGLEECLLSVPAGTHHLYHRIIPLGS
jgi:hypothetical protein